MTAEVVEFPKPEPGNGAREVLLDAVRYARNCENPAVLADHILGCLWQAGFKIAPLEPGDEDLRA